MADKLNLEILLSKVEIQQRKLNTTHVVNVTLLYPRMGISARSAEKEVKLQNGMADHTKLSWCRRILFKEQVDDHFGIKVEFSESLSKAKLRAMGRFILGGALGIAGNAVEDALPVAGDFLELPFQYMGKNLQKAMTSADIWLEGDADLMTDTLPEMLTIPLVAKKDICKVERVEAAGGRTTRMQSKVLVKAGAVVGQVTLALRII